MSENQAYDIIVVGASAAGLRAAARARRLLSNAKILVIDEDTYISYAACGMPYYVSGDIDNADKLRKTAYGIVRDPEYFRTAKGLEVIIDTRVERIDRDARKVIAARLRPGRILSTPMTNWSWPWGPVLLCYLWFPKVANASLL